MTDPTPSPERTPVDAGRLRELLDEASPRPWRTHDTWLSVGGFTATVIRNDRTKPWAAAWFPSWSGEPGDLYRSELKAWQDAQLTAAAVNALPFLLDEVEALRAERDHFRDLCGQHDPTGADHLADAARLVAENDDLRAAAGDLCADLSGQSFDSSSLRRLRVLLGIDADDQEGDRG